MIWRRSRPSNLALEQLQADLLSMGMESVRLQCLSKELLLEGSVPSYEAKREVTSRVASFRWPVRNCLRIVPGEEVSIAE